MTENKIEKIALIIGATGVAIQITLMLSGQIYPLQPDTPVRSAHDIHQRNKLVTVTDISASTSTSTSSTSSTTTTTTLPN